MYYYPMAGRLREILPTNKLVVDCTGEGVVFVEALASRRLWCTTTPWPVG